MSQNQESAEEAGIIQEIQEAANLLAGGVDLAKAKVDGKMSKPVIDYKKCSVSKTCIEVCPMDVFEVQTDKSGKEKVVVAKPEECINCKACEVQCPKGAIKVED